MALPSFPNQRYAVTQASLTPILISNYYKPFPSSISYLAALSGLSNLQRRPQPERPVPTISDSHRASGPPVEGLGQTLFTRPFPVYFGGQLCSAFPLTMMIVMMLNFDMLLDWSVCDTCLGYVDSCSLILSLHLSQLPSCIYVFMSLFPFVICIYAYLYFDIIYFIFHGGGHTSLPHTNTDF